MMAILTLNLPPITGLFPHTLEPGVVVRPFTPDDAQDVLEAMKPHRDYLGRFDPWVNTHMATRKQIEANIATHNGLIADGKGLTCGVWVEGEFAVRFMVDIDPDNLRAELGYMRIPGPHTDHRGLVTKTGRMLVDRLFLAGCMRIWLTCRVDNTASIRVAERLGMTHEGIKRCFKRVGDTFFDSHEYAIIRGDWLSGVYTAAI
jgi:RimJ/RimL family protein N-acetyltransferase